MEDTKEVTDKELSEMIADLCFTDEWPNRVRVCHALIELRDLRKRWAMFSWCFPWMERFMVWLSRKRKAPL